MAAFILLAVLFVVLVVASIAGWCVDSRDSRFSLWPLNPVGPNDPAVPDAIPRCTPPPPTPARASHSAVVPERRDDARRPGSRSASGRRAVRTVYPTVKRQDGCEASVTSPRHRLKRKRTGQP